MNLEFGPKQTSFVMVFDDRVQRPLEHKRRSVEVLILGQHRILYVLFQFVESCMQKQDLGNGKWEMGNKKQEIENRKSGLGSYLLCTNIDII